MPYCRNEKVPPANENMYEPVIVADESMRNMDEDVGIGFGKRWDMLTFEI